MKKTIGDMTETIPAQQVFYFHSPYGRLGIIEEKGRKVVAWGQAVFTVFRLWCRKVIRKML
jgi:hypothetical protein